MIGVLMGLLCAMCWASGSVLTKGLSRKLDPFTVNAPRTLIGGVVLVLVALLTGRAPGYQVLSTDQLFFMVASMWIGGGMGDSLYVSSLSRIGVSRAFPIANSYPAITLILGLVFLQEAVSLPIVGGLILVLAGIMVMSRVAGRSPAAAIEETNAKRGIGAALMASFCWAASMILVAPGVEGVDSILVGSIRVPALSLALWVVVLARGTYRDLAKLNRADWIRLVVGAIIGWALGSCLFVLTVDLLGATRTAIITSTSPLFALPMSILFLREDFNPKVLIGTALTVAGIILVS